MISTSCLAKEVVDALKTTIKSFRKKSYSVILISIQNNNLLAAIRYHGVMALPWQPSNMFMQRNNSYALSLRRSFLNKMRHLSYSLFFIIICQ